MNIRESKCPHAADELSVERARRDRQTNAERYINSVAFIKRNVSLRTVVAL